MTSGLASGSFSLSDQRGQMKVTVNVYSTSGYYGYLETFISVQESSSFSFVFP
jgi:hypothetical protein